MNRKQLWKLNCKLCEKRDLVPFSYSRFVYYIRERKLADEEAIKLFKTVVKENLEPKPTIWKRVKNWFLKKKNCITSKKLQK